MSISEWVGKGKKWWAQISLEALYGAVLITASVLCFSLGVLAGQDIASSPERAGFAVIDASAPQKGFANGQGSSFGSVPEQPLPSIPEGGQYVASKNGEAYYLPWCSGVSRIKEENKVWFGSKEEAEARGYRPAKTCKGM